MKIGMNGPGNTVDAAPAQISRGTLASVLASSVIVLSTVCMASTASVSAAGNEHPIPSVALACDDGLTSAMSGDADTKVLLVRQFKQGEPLLLAEPNATAPSTGVEGAPNAAPPTAGIDLCLVKLLVGPSSPGPAEAASTSAGIGIEVLLPSPDKWNQRIRAYGNSGWAGTPQTSLYLIASNDLHAAAAAKGFVVATSDHGHVGAPPLTEINPSFAVNPDGSINTVGWKDFSEEVCMSWPRRPRR